MAIPTSTLNLYKECQIIPDRRIVVDDISTYLATLTKKKIEDFQYIRHSLNLEIKVDLEQTHQEFEDNYNYCSIQNSDSEKVVYYFIKKIRQRANETILFELELDVLNTFEWNKDFAVSPKTEVFREHKDRWHYISGESKYRAIVDFYSEGINAPLYQTNKTQLSDTKVNTKWYLIYKNRTTPTEGSPAVIDCYCAPESAISAKVNSEDVFNGYNAPSGYRYICISPLFYLSQIRCLTSNGNNYYTSVDSSSDYYGFIVNVFTDNTISVQRVHFLNGSITIESTEYCDYCKFYLGGTPMQSIACQLRTLSQGLPNDLPSGSDNGTWDCGEQIYNLTPFSSLDRSDVLLNKIIALPYFPSNYTMSGTTMVIPNEWFYDSVTGFLKLVNLNTKFSNNITTQVTDGFKSTIYPHRASSYFVDGTRDDKYEPKLYHSDFYQVKLTYDSFSYVIPAETINANSLSYIITNFQFTFKVTNTMNSRFLFSVSYPRIYIQEDYQVLSVARNNEVVLYNSPYLNYLRTSYNYDVKARDRQIKTTEIGSTIGLIGSSASMVMSWASMNPVVAISGTTSAGTSIANNIVNRINSVAQAEENFEKKQEEMKIQSVNVIGSDDLDLFESYAGNKAYLFIYQVSDRMKSLISNLFYYCGYKTNETKIPNVSTRRNFNYLECNLQVVEYKNNLGGKYIPSDCMDRLKQLYLLGVTFIHKYNSTWDIHQESTNLETSIQ